MNAKRGDSSWIQTYSGRQFWPLDPHVDDVDINDIAHALSLKVRYGGHCKDFYSVAQHSWLVTEAVRDRLAISQIRMLRTALLHDAAEAYTADIVRPIKHLISGFKEIEERIEQVIAEKFNLIYPFPDAIKEADIILLETERRDLMNKSDAEWKRFDAEPLRDRIDPLCWRAAKAKFLYLFYSLRSDPQAEEQLTLFR
jgi:hypothetical protein